MASYEYRRYVAGSRGRAPPTRRIEEGRLALEAKHIRHTTGRGRLQTPRVLSVLEHGAGATQHGTSGPEGTPLAPS